MLAKDLISDTIPALHTSDTAITALNWMEIFKISHLPIVNNKELLGLISDVDIYDLNNPEEAVGNHELSLTRPFVYQNQHIYEVIEIVSRLKLTVIPVLNEDKEFLGLINLNDLLHYFSSLMAIQNPGGIIIIELNVNDYSLSEIAQIIETNDAKILSLYIDSHPDTMKLNITIKINKSDLTSILQTFERYNYNIKATFMENNELDDLYKDRYDSFIKFLDI
ncbi:MAG: hypothetical protein DRJ01_00300 [Bacteroidetes bacterium]|nr:MAG: hypothetical protein DRJ01_00300 [Bacteroidota bacterium]